MLRYYIVPLEVVDEGGQDVIQPALDASISWVGQPDPDSGTYIIKTPDTIDATPLADPSTQVLPLWEAGETVEEGDVREYDGIAYRCVQGHTTQAMWTPPVVPALWTPYRPPGVITRWRQPLGAQDAYHLDEMVSHNGSIWATTVDNNVWEPGVFGWTKVDPMEPEAVARGLVPDDLRQRWAIGGER